MSVIIITGSACSGKTSLIKEFELEGYKTYSESAGAVIKSRRAEGRYLPWEIKYNKYSWLGFEREVYDTQIRYFDEIYNDICDHVKRDIILDRGSEDILAYSKINNINKIPHWWKPTKEILNTEDIKVFVLKPLSDYQVDDIRNPENNQNKEYVEIIECYNQYGYDLTVENKVQSIENRMQWIVDFL